MGLISSILQKIKSNKDLKQGVTSSIESLFTPVFSGAYDATINDVFMSCAYAHARHASKFRPELFRGDEASTDPAKTYLNRVLSLRPNPQMNAAQFYERLAISYYIDCNVFIFLEWDFSKYNEPLKGMWILDLEENAMEIKVTSDGRTILSFNLNGEPYFTGMENIIHIARNPGPNLLGERNPAIRKVLEVIGTNYEGIEQAIRTSAFIRFIVQSSTLLNDDVRKSRAKEFAEAYLGKSSSGVVYLDAATSIVPVVANNKYANAEEMKLFENKIYNYMGISEEILKAKFNEDVWQSYYDSSLEPLANKIAQEMTYKIFTSREIGEGNRIVINADRLDSASLKTKILLAQVIQKLPTYRPNDINRLLGMPTTENGDKEFSTLNFVESDKQNEYQGVGGSKNEEEGNPDGNT